LHVVEGGCRDMAFSWVAALVACVAAVESVGPTIFPFVRGVLCWALVVVVFFVAIVGLLLGSCVVPCVGYGCCFEAVMVYFVEMLLEVGPSLFCGGGVVPKLQVCAEESGVG
jgi:hypothetical protein